MSTSQELAPRPRWLMPGAAPSSLQRWASALGRLAYRPAAGRRDIRLDFLRGWCIFSMVVDHAADQRSSPMFAITGNGPWPMTGAHGFVMLSGVVMGLLYAHVIRQQGVRSAMAKLGRRAAKLYVVAIGLGLLGLLWEAAPWASDPGAFQASALPDLALLQSGSDELMTLYLVLVLLAAPVLLACQRRLWPVVLGASVAIWIVHNRNESLLNLPITYFVPVADWQLLFVAGLLIGFHRDAIGAWLRGPLKTAFVALVLVILAATVALQSGLALRGLDEIPGWLSTVQEQGWQGYDHNPPLHMLLVFANLFALYYLVTWTWAAVAGVLGWFLIPLGQAALYVYIVHMVLVYYVLAAAPLFGSLQGPVLTVALLGLMLVIWGLVKRRFLFGLIPR